MALERSDDADLVEGLRRGSASAADELVDRFAGPLTRYFAAHLPDSQAAEDMTQEVFFRLIRACRSRQTREIQSLYSFVFTMARHLALDVCKTQGRRPRLESLDANQFDDSPGPQMVEPIAPGPDPRQLAASDEQRNLLEQALRKIPQEYREALVLRHIQGLSGKEIATVLGVAEGTVWSRVGRGLQELKNLLGSESRSNPQPPHRSGERQ